MSNTPKMEITWVQNLKALVERGMFRDDERWKKIFIEKLDETSGALQSAADTPPSPYAHVRAAAEAAEKEIRRLHHVLTPHYEGKVAEPDLSIADRLKAALAATATEDGR